MLKLPIHRAFLITTVLACIMLLSLTALAQRQTTFTTSYLKDTESQLTFSEVTHQEFTKIDASQLIFGVTAATYWVKIDLENLGDSPFILTIDRPLLDTLNIYIVQADSSIKTIQFGLRHERPGEAIINRVPSVKIDPEDLLYNTIYLQCQSTYAMLLPVEVHEVQDFYLANQRYDFFAAILLGALVVMMFYNLFLWISVREDAYLIYFFAILFTIIVQSSVQGYPFMLFSRDFWLPYYFVSVGIGINVILSVWFCMKLLDYRNFSKWMIVACFVIMSMGAAIVILELFDFHYLAKTIVVSSTSLGAILLLTIGSLLWYRKVTAAKFFTIAWAIYLVGIVVYGFRTEGILEQNFFTSNFVHIGKFCEVLLLSFAVGYKYNAVKKDKEKLQQHLNTELEYQVRQRTEALNRALADKDVLIKEVHHRVKNNLQIVSSILSMQSRKLIDKEAQSAVDEGRSRIRSMSLIHEKLYKNDKLSRVNMKEYINELSEYLFTSYRPEKEVKQKIEADNVILDIDTAIPLGLILNELITNSLKYAFRDVDDGILEIELEKNVSDFTLTFSDNGPGLPSDYQNTKSMGMRLVRTLTDQLGGTLSIDSTAGTKYTIHFRLAG